MAMTGSVRKVIKGGAADAAPKGTNIPEKRRGRKRATANEINTVRHKTLELVRATKYRATRQDVAQEMERS